MAKSFRPTIHSEIARRMYRPGVIAIGTNGTVGPQRMLGIIRSLHGATDAILSAQPDIGIPTLVDGHPVYNATMAMSPARRGRLSITA